MKRGSQRETHQSHRRTGDAAARNRAGAEGIIDLSRLERADGERRAHGDDLRVEPVLAIKTAFLGGPRVEESQRFRGNRNADPFGCALARGAEGSKARKEQQRNQNREETRSHRQHFCTERPERLQVTDERMKR